MSFCTACGRPSSGPVRYCTACGAPFPAAVGTEAPVAEPPASAPPPPPPPVSGQYPDTVTVYRPRDGGSAAPPAGRSKAFLAVLAAVAVLAAGGGAAFWLTHRHQARPAALGAQAAATSSVPQSPATRGGPATRSAAAGTGSERAEVAQIAPEIRRSASARTTVLTATGAVGRCTMVPSTGISLMNQAISQRQVVIARLGSLSVNAIPGGQVMLADFKRVLQASITADRGFIGWMQDIQRKARCPVRTSTDASYQEGLRASARAVTAKKEFLALWNPLARKFGLPAFTASKI